MKVSARYPGLLRLQENGNGRTVLRAADASILTRLIHANRPAVAALYPPC